MLYVAPEDERTDYVSILPDQVAPALIRLPQSQPPMANWYSGVLKYVHLILEIPWHPIHGSLFSTGKRRYGHPALNGVLPQPWLPLKKGQTLRNGAQAAANGAPTDTPAVVLTLRKRRSIIRPQSVGTVAGSAQDGAGITGTSTGQPGVSAGNTPIDIATANPWQDELSTSPVDRAHPHRLHHRLSFDQPSGVIILPDEDWLEESDSDEEYAQGSAPGGSPGAGVDAGGGAGAAAPKRYATYYHHPERRKRT